MNQLRSNINLGKRRRPTWTKLAEWTPSVFQFVADILAMGLSAFVYYYLKFFSGMFDSDMPAGIAANPILILFTIAGLTLYWILLFWVCRAL